jgi:putative transcriptional regulator
LLKRVSTEKPFNDQRSCRQDGNKQDDFIKILNHPGHSTTTENIDKLCEFFKCSVEDLMVHIPKDND